MKSLQRNLVLAAVLTLAAAAAIAVPRLTAPTKFLDSDARYRCAVVKVVELTDEGRFRLEVVERLRGETPDDLAVYVVGGPEHALLEVGKSYIVGHTDKPARRSHRWQVDPNGPRVLSVPAVGQAVFEDSVPMRALVREHPEDAPLTGKARLEAVLSSLDSSDAQSLRFVAAELVLAPELRELVGDAELERLRRALASDLEPMAHDYLLRAALPMVESWGGDWLAEDARSVISSHGSELDLASLIPSLLVTALRTLEQTGEKADAALARPHVASNNPGVGKAAFQAMVTLDRELAGKVVADLGDGAALHPDTRRFVHETASREALESDAR